MQFHAPTRSLLIQAADPFAIRESIPKSKLVHGAGYNVAVKHTTESTRVLRNLGYDVPAPINTYYKWPGSYAPFGHQRVIAEFMTLHKRCFNLSDMGTGKTAASLWAADWLMNERKVQRVMVLSPLSTLERVWQNDIFNVLMHRTAVVVHGTMAKRCEAMKQDVDFYIVNHDGISITQLRNLIIAREDIDLIIVDEGSKFRNYDTDKFRALEKIMKSGDRRLWWLTGTPFPNTPADGWAQCKLINPSSVPKYFGAFRNQTMVQLNEHLWKPRTDAYEVAYNAMQPAIRFRKEDCLTLPPVTVVDWEAPLSKEQVAAFKKMKNEMYLEYVKDKLGGHTITAANAADKLNKLRQILCGAIRSADGSYVPIPHVGRTQLALDAIESAAAKAILIVPFKGIIKSLEAELSKRYTVGLLNGDVSATKRNAIIQAYKETPNPHVLLCHPAVMAHGLNLTEADLLAFYAPIYSNDEYRQVVERFNRPGQTRKMTVVRIGAHPLEWAIYKSLDSRDATQHSILKLYHDTMSGTK